MRSVISAEKFRRVVGWSICSVIAIAVTVAFCGDARADQGR